MANVLLRTGAAVVAALGLGYLYAGCEMAPSPAPSPASSPAVSSSPAAAASLCHRCNVVLISFDTVRADHLGTYGYERATSPNVDKLAARSLVFEEAMSQSPWTLPSHASMLSGLYGSRLGVLKYPATRTLSDQNVVLPEVFRANGYATAGFVGGGFVSKHYGFDRGFDVYSNEGPRFEHNMNSTLDWIDEHKGGPFFLFVHGYDAHRPYYSKTMDKESMGFPSGVEREQGHYCLGEKREKPEPERFERIVRYYDSAIHHGDRAIGVLLTALEKLDLTRRTIVLLTSDHGEEFFEHGGCDHVRFLYRESLHVPLILQVPGVAPRRVPGVVPASISVSRTVLDLVGIEHAMPGTTLMPVLRGEPAAFPIVYSEAASVRGKLGSRGRCVAMMKDGLKLITYTDEGTDEAFDVFADPTEKSILPMSHAAYRMKTPLLAWSGSLRPLPKPARALLPPDPEGAEIGADNTSARRAKAREARQKARKKDSLPAKLEEELKALGYLE